jgi:DNA-binding GntR family transcriptional regulator
MCAAWAMEQAAAPAAIEGRPHKVDLVRQDTLRAYEQIKQKITTLHLEPGEPVDEDALAGELDLGATAIREALKLLAHDGLIVVTPRHGIRVAEANPGDLSQLFEMRLPLEMLCARMAAERATRDDIAVMDALVREAAQAQSGRDLDRLLELDHRYHLVLATASHNQFMLPTLERFFGLSERLWHLALPEVDWLIAALERHAEMVDAIKARDGERAATLMAEHVLDFQRQVEQSLGLAGE